MSAPVSAPAASPRANWNWWQTFVPGRGRGAGPGRGGREAREVAGGRRARVYERPPGRQRLLERHPRRERLVVDVDQLERRFGRRLVDRGDRRHRLALVACDVDRENRPVA